ncbi:MAG: HepT-like ribonuclease domain-containing protein [Actinomycetes bacterium]
MPWQEIAGMRDRLTHHYFDTSHAILQATIDHDIPLLWDAVGLLREALAGDHPQG